MPNQSNQITLQDTGMLRLYLIVHKLSALLESGPDITSIHERNLSGDSTHGDDYALSSAVNNLALGADGTETDIRSEIVETDL